MKLLNHERLNRHKRNSGVSPPPMLMLEVSEKDILALSGQIITSAARWAHLRQCGLIDQYGRISAFARKRFSLPPGAFIRRKKPKGHWPKGKPRSSISPSLYAEFMCELQAAASRLSLRAIGRITGKDSKQISKWISGTHRPTEPMAKAMLARLAANQTVMHEQLGT